jgi:hypothetical protein
VRLEHPCGHTWRAPELEGECEVCRVLEEDEEAEEDAAIWLGWSVPPAGGRGEI